MDYPIRAARGRVIIVGDAASFQEVENQGPSCVVSRQPELLERRQRVKRDLTGSNTFWQKSFEFNDPEILKTTWKTFIFGHLGNDNLDYLYISRRGKCWMAM